MNNWHDCKNILCIRLDNMGDLIMTGPAIRALKETFNAKITVLTSSAAAGISPVIPGIDDLMIFDAPWVRLNDIDANSGFGKVIDEIRNRNFDAAVIFTVYSQNPLPNVMLAYLANIPLRLAYCRENPYQLLTHWVPDKEPYDTIKHQVKRDLDLVATVGAYTQDQRLKIKTFPNLWLGIIEKLKSSGFDMARPWLILHPGVSEKKRQFPIGLWAEAGKLLIEKGYQIIITGSASEKELTGSLKSKIGPGCISTGGAFTLNELCLLIEKSPLLIAVNTGTVHIAAAVQTPVVVLYALTNPQHTPWQVPCKVLPFEVEDHLHSKNEVIRYVNHFYEGDNITYPSAEDILQSASALLENPETGLGNELCLIDRFNN